MEKWLLILLMIPFTFGTVIDADSCSYEDVRAAIDGADYSDTVRVPAGDCAWPQTMDIKKGINLAGAGVDRTNISYGGTYTTNAASSIIFIDPDTYSAQNDIPFGVSGFTLKFYNKLYSLIWVGNCNNLEYPLTRIRIYNNKLVNSDTEGGVGIINDCRAYGVAYNNTIIDGSHTSRFGGTYALWGVEEEWEPGTMYAFYYEDNNISATKDSDSSMIMSGGGCNRHVTRYNTYDLSGQDATGFSQAFDQHGNQPNNAGPSVGSEVYGNLRIGRNGRFMDARAGSMRFFYNKWIATSNSFGIYVWEEYDDEEFGPITNCPSWKDCTAHVNDAYVWNVRDGAGGLHSASILSDYYTRDPPTPNDPPVLVENREFWTQRNAEFTGNVAEIGTCGYRTAEDTDGPACTASGVGCGRLEDMPETCTPGVAYWATEQSCTDLSGMVGAYPSTPIDGTLYKCTQANTWEPYYRPYIYPHPLRVAPNEMKICGEGEITEDCWCEGLRTEGECRYGYYQNKLCLSLGSLIQVIDDWKLGTRTISQVMEGIMQWKSGC